MKKLKKLPAGRAAGGVLCGMHVNDGSENTPD